MTRVIRILALGAMLLELTEAAAQEGQRPVETVPRLEEVVVTATKTLTPVGQTGSSVSVITREEIVRRQAPDIVDILRGQPGFSLIQTGTRGALNGAIFTRGGNNDMNQVLIDGMKVNSGGGFFDFRDIATAGIGRVEIVRGPQSALYGADAMTAVIQMFTPRGQGPFAAWVSGGIGNYTTHEERAGWSWGNRLAGVFFEYDHVETGGILRINDGYRNDTGVLRLDLSPTPDLDFTATGRFNQSRINFPTENAGDRLQGALDPHQFSDNERLIATVTTRYAQAPWLEHRLKLGLHVDNSLNRDLKDVPPDSAKAADEGTRSRRNEDRRLVDYSTVLSPPTMAGVTPRVVLGASHDYQHFTDRVRPVVTSRTNVARENNAGYGQLQLGVLERVFLTGGLRYDSSSVFGGELTPRVALAVVAPVTGTRVRGAWGTGIKEPSFGAQFGFPASGIPANPTIKAERSESWEAGVDQPLFGSGLDVGVTYFENRFRDLVTFPGGGQSAKNIQGARSDGVELVLALKPVKGWTASGQYTFLETEVTDDGGVGGTAFPRGQALLRRPTHSGGLGVGYQEDRLSASLNLFVKGRSIDRDFRFATAPRVTLGGYEKLDLSVGYVLFKNVLGLREVVLKTRFQNVLNEKYEEVFGFSSPRLSFLTAAELRY